MLLPDLPPDVKFSLLQKSVDELRYSFEAKRAALGPYIIERWGWDEQFQLDAHRTRFREKPFFRILQRQRDVGTISVMRLPDHIRLGEFYLFPDNQRQGLGSRILKHCLSLADGERRPVRLEYLKWNPVGALYQRNGFIVTGETDIHWLMERPARGDRRVNFGHLTRMVQIRQGSAAHYPFALELYLSTMRPYTEELMTWDEQKQRHSFAAQWRIDEVKIIAVDGQDIGWLQISETPLEIRLQQFFISPQHQRAGIGAEVLSNLIATWRVAGKPIALTLLKNNPARRLYERFAFSVVGEVGVKFEMKRYP